MEDAEVLKRGLAKLAGDLDEAPRHGAPVDRPEGVRYLRVSDTAAKALSDLLRRLAGEKPVHEGPEESEVPA